MIFGRDVQHTHVSGTDQRVGERKGRGGRGDPAGGMSATTVEPATRAMMARYATG